MKYKIVLLFLLGAFLFQSCKTFKNTDKSNKGKPLTEKMRYKESDLFTQAVILKVTGKYTEAEEMMKKALEIDSLDPAANYQEAKILTILGRKDEAVEFAAKAMKLDENNKWYKKLYADLQKAAGNYKEYLDTYKILAEKYPEDIDFLTELAFAYYFTGDYENAVFYYNKLEQKIGLNEMLTKQIAELYTRIGQPEKAVDAYQKLINAFPDEKHYYALLAEYCLKNNMPEKAKYAYEKILELDPADPYVHISLAGFYRKNGDPEKAFDQLKKGFENKNLDLKTKINLLLTYYSGKLDETQKKEALELSEILKKVHPGEDLSEAFYATMLYENKRYQEAEIITRKIIKNNNTNYASWEQLLFCDLYLSRYDTLAADADSAVDLFPNQPIPYWLGGIANFQLKNFNKAKTLLENAKELTVNNNALLEQIYSILGDTYNKLKMYDKSYEAYEKVLAINPENSIVLNNYAYYLSLRNLNLDKAEKMAAKAVELDPYNQNNLDTYAWVFYKLKKYDKALMWEQKALDNGGDSSGVVLEHMGDIYYQLGNKTEALKWWKKASEKKNHSDLLDKKIKDGKLYE